MRLFRFLWWAWFAGIRHRHFSLTCYGESPCDPLAHMTIAAMWGLSR